MSQEEKKNTFMINATTFHLTAQIRLETVRGTKRLILTCQQLPIKISILVPRATGYNTVDLCEPPQTHMIRITQRHKLCSEVLVE